MEAFDYAALDAAGKRKKGTVMASSARDARDILRARALMPLDLAPSKSKKKEDISGTASGVCLLYTSPSPRDGLLSRMPSSA